MRRPRNVRPAPVALLFIVVGAVATWQRGAQRAELEEQRAREAGAMAARTAEIRASWSAGRPEIERGVSDIFVAIQERRLSDATALVRDLDKRLSKFRGLVAEDRDVAAVFRRLGAAKDRLVTVEKDEPIPRPWDCPPPPYDESAVAAVIDTLKAPHRFPKFRTRANPLGKGVLVSTFRDENKGFGADWQRYRLIWLVLDGKVYALSVEAGRASNPPHGTRGEPPRDAGLPRDFWAWWDHPGAGGLGIEEESFERNFSGGNPFPQCTDPAPDRRVRAGASPPVR